MNDLQEFIKKLEKNNQLVRISHPVSLHLEITEIHKRVIDQGGPALLFENCLDREGNKATMPVLVNLFGTKQRISEALYTSPDKLRELGEILAFFRQPKPFKNIKEAFSYIPLLRKVMAMSPKIVKNAPCQAIVHNEVNLDKLPIQWCWPGEPAPLISFGLTITKGPNNNEEVDDYNMGVYRMQKLSKDKVIMRWLSHRGSAQHFKRWKEQNPGKDMPIAVAIGAEPSILMAAITPVPDNLSEYKFAGLIKGSKPKVVKAKTVDILVPASAEIVLEGYVSCTETALEGPYGDHTGYYNEVERFPVMKVTAITTNKSPVYHSTFTSRPVDEPSVLGDTLGEVMVPLLKQQFPEIVDFYLPPDACSYRMAVVSIKKAYPGHAARIMMGVWSFLRQFMYTKFVVIVDDDINVKNYKDVIWAISTNVDPVRDVTIVDNTPIDYLDFASVEAGLGSKMSIDATTKIGNETKRNWGRKLDMDDETKAAVTKMWSSLGIDLK